MLLIAPWCVALFVLFLIQKIKYEDEVVISAIFFKPTTNLCMKLAVKRENQVLEIYTKWLLGYINVYLTTHTYIFNDDTCFNGTSVNKLSLIISSTSNFFTTIFEPGSTYNLRIHD